MNILKSLGLAKSNVGAYAGVNWCSKKHDACLPSINPANGETIATVYGCNEQDYQQLIEMAQQAFEYWVRVPAPKRGEIVRQIGNELRQEKEALSSLVALETGKSKREAAGEVQEMIDMADFAVGQSRMLYGKTMHSERSEHRLYEQWHPYGLVGIISAFNFPVAVWSWNAFIGAICGNVMIWKPSEKTPLCALAIQQICNKVLKRNELPAVFNVFIPQDHKIITNFVEDRHVPLISFTGSTQAGRRVATQVAARLGRSILELGGNNAIIVDETADLKLAVPAIVFAAIGTAGQRCTTTRRLIVHESIYQTLLDKLIIAYRQILIGDPLNPKHLMGPVIDQAAVEAYSSALQQVRQQGGKVVFGGEVIAQPGFYVQPTIVVNVQNDWDIVQTETFAPILYVLKYQTLAEAIALHNGVAQGLSSALFTTHLHHAEKFLSAQGSDCGIVNINAATSGAEIGGAFGGEKDSGGGRESGSDAWKAYMRRQTSTINWGNDMPLAQGIEFA